MAATVAPPSHAYSGGLRVVHDLMTEPKLTARRVPEITHVEPLTTDQITKGRRAVRRNATDPDDEARLLSQLGLDAS